MHDVAVQFTPEDVHLALAFVAARERESQHRKDAYGLVKKDHATELRRQLGAVLGEWAVSNILGLAYVFTVNTFKAPDIWLPDGRGIQVKTPLIEGSLIIHPDAKEEEVYVLTYYYPLSGGGARIVAKGWTTVYEANLMGNHEPSLWRDPLGRGPCLFIPPGLLRDMDSLRNTHTHVGLYGPQRSFR